MDVAEPRWSSWNDWSGVCACGEGAVASRVNPGVEQVLLEAMRELLDHAE